LVKLDKTRSLPRSPRWLPGSLLLSLFNIGGRFFWASLSRQAGPAVSIVFCAGRVDVFQRARVQLPAASSLFVGAFCVI
jgi:hypothetical protein